MKKFLSVFMVCFLSFLLVGCGCDKDKNKDKDKNNGKDSSVEERISKTVKSLYTDDEKLVYDNGGVYKIVYYYSGTKITGYEHYYEYKDDKAAEDQYKKDKENYKNDTSMKAITRNGKYVVYTFVASQYEGKTVDEIQNTYSFLKPVYEK